MAKTVGGKNAHWEATLDAYSQQGKLNNWGNRQRTRKNQPKKKQIIKGAPATNRLRIGANGGDITFPTLIRGDPRDCVTSGPST